MDDEDYSENSDGSFNSEKDFITLSKKSKRTELSYIDDSSLSGIKSKYKRTRSPPYCHLFITPTKRKVIEKKQPDQFQITLTENQLTTFNNNFSLLKADFEILEDYEKKFFKDTTLDIMFIMDITGSMGMWLSEAKANITNIINEIIENNPCSKIRIGFVGYRDFTEEGKPIGQYVSLDFTSNVEEAKTFISQIEVNGGGDEPEDIAGGLELVLNMKWESNARYAVLVCDAPCHGNKYHGTMYDKYSDGDPNGLVIEDLISSFVKKNITLYCIEINDSTKKMFAIMKEIYEGSKECEFHVKTLGNATNQFAFFVAFTASVTLGNITYNRTKLEDVIKTFRDETIETIIKKYNKDPTSILNDVLIDEIEGLALSENEQKMFSFINRMSSLNINKEKTLSNSNEETNDIVIELNGINIQFNHYYQAIAHSIECKKDAHLINNWTSPIVAKNKFRTQFSIDSLVNVHFDIEKNVYYLILYDYTLNKKIHCEIMKTIPKIYYDNIDKMIEDKLRDNALCNHLADYFNLRLLEYCPDQKIYIKFRRLFLYEIDSFPSKYLIGYNDSNEINKDNTVKLSKTLLEAFSHFSYQFTEGNMIVTNLKDDSNQNLIIDYHISKLQNDDHGNIMKFFVSHYCNDICKKLKLIHPRKKKTDFTLTNEFYLDHLITGAKLCELCKKPLQSKDDVCVSCTEKTAISTKKKICSECHNMFTYSCYYYNVQMIDYPEKCGNCTFRF